MAKGVNFGSIHSNTDLGLILLEQEEGTAIPKTIYVDIPGADGSKDLTEALGEIKYEDREYVWKFGLYPGENWASKQRQIANALNGRIFHIELDSDPGFYLIGRTTVEKYTSDSILRQITITARCHPYKFKNQLTEVIETLTTDMKAINLFNLRRSVIPTIEVSRETVLAFNDLSMTVSPGIYRFEDIRLIDGNNILNAAASSESGSIKITYREATL